MPDLTLSLEDMAIISLSLAITEQLLFKSRYEPEIQTIIADRIKWLQQYLERRATYSNDYNSDSSETAP